MPRLAVSQKERVLLHLLDNDRLREEAEVPMAVCQEGIAAVLSTQVHNASRSLSSLQEEGLVLERLAHVRGAGRRRKAYFLTERGSKAAKRITDDILPEQIILRTDGGEKRMTMSEAMRPFNNGTGKSMTLLEILRSISPEGELDITKLGKEKKEAGRKEPLSRSFGRPSDEGLVGRDRETMSVLSSLDGSILVMVVWGIPGIGKSSLGSHVFERIRGSKPVFWHTVREWDSSTALIKEISDLLAAEDLSDTSEALAKGCSLSELFPILATGLGKLRGTVFLDDVHKASTDTAAAISLLVEAARVKGTTKVVLMSRTLPDIISLSRSDVMTLELRGLEDAPAMELASGQGGKDPGEVVKLSLGHPLLIKMLSRSGQISMSRDINTYIEELLRTLSHGERLAMGLLSVFREPVGMEAMPGIDPSALTSLRKQGLVIEEEGMWVHELIRDRVCTLMPVDERTNVHLSAASYYSMRTDARSRSEELYHLSEARDGHKVLRLLEESGQELTDNAPEEVILALSKIPVLGDQIEDMARSHYWKGEALRSLGRYNEAVGEYESGLAMLSEGSALKGAMFEGMAKAHRETSKWDESLDSHTKALQEYLVQNDLDSQIRELLSIGSIHRMKGDISTARGMFDRALELAKDNIRIRAACLNNIALADWDEGNIDKAEEELRTSMRLAREANDCGGEGRALENLACLYRNRGRMEERAEVLKEAATAYTRSSEIESAVRMEVMLAEHLSSIDRGDEAVDVLKRALASLPKRPLGGRSQSARSVLKLAIISILRSQGDLRGAVDEGSRTLRSLKNTGDGGIRAHILMEMALAYDGMGDVDDTRQVLDQAEGLIRSLGDPGGIVAVLIRKGMLEEKEGNVPKALEHYRAALWHAERTDDARAVASALENIAMVMEPGTEEWKIALTGSIARLRGTGSSARAERLEALLKDIPQDK